MFFSLIKTNITNNPPKLNTPFVAKGKFIDLDFKKCGDYKDFRVDYTPLTTNQVNYQSLIRVWYLVLAIRMVRVPLIGGKMGVFSYRRTKLFSKYQDVYTLSLSKHFYETLVEHRNTFYYLTISTFSIDRLHLITSLYDLKTKSLDNITVIKKRSSLPDMSPNVIHFILRHKWGFKIVEFL
jgi:hypothetical protein